MAAIRLIKRKKKYQKQGVKEKRNTIKIMMIKRIQRMI
jgi:hypothetical protein